MIRFYSSILISSILLSSTTVHAQSLQTRSTFLSQDKSASELSTAKLENQTFYTDSDSGSKPEPCKSSPTPGCSRRYNVSDMLKIDS